ncbi:unnamed protein product [Haemonchus placei]|uniref:L-lactate dehydrogenase n=1 Tax=Haemonchus placei TaxID=6290 RepID=A0A0N4X8Z5_HAEPC|nr:unnamed protein product [Haemonchus placei]
MTVPLLCPPEMDIFVLMLPKGSGPKHFVNHRMAATVHEVFEEIAPITTTPHGKVTVVGVGQVGMACAYSILQQDFRCTVQSISNFIPVMAAFYCPNGSGIFWDTQNVEIFKGIIPNLVKYSPDTILMVVSNPVDVLTYVTWKISGLPKERVFGSGTNLDSARFRFLLSEKLHIAPSSCHGWIIGEHGDSSVAVWSGVNVAGVTLSNVKPEIGGSEDDEHWEQEIHKKVVER